jgi:hypothetical protein
MKRRAFFALAILLFLSACGTPLVWDKPGLTAQMRADDQADCQRLAWRQAVEVQNDLWFQSRMGFGRYPFGYRTYPGYSVSRYDLEDRFFATCLQAKGYRLVPLQTGG